nr:cyclophilin-like fold protein [uncultured Oscillibacter sp.]
MHIPLRKQLPALFISLCMILGLVSCGTEPPDADVSQEAAPPQAFQSEESPDISASESPSNILIAYFSLWDNAPWDENTDTSTSASVVVDDQGAIGTTGYVARMIQEAVSGDIHVIQATEPYPADFDAVVDENHQESSRAISSTVENMEQYDTVFIGYPVWATTLPQAVRTFLTTYDFSGKTVIPFCTHNGYGAGRSFSTVAELAAGSLALDGIAIQASDVPEAQDTVAAWLSELGFEDTPVASQGETSIRITVEGTELEGVLYDSDMAHQFIAQLPQTIPMTNYGGREVYGGIGETIEVEGSGQLRFDDGDITYCPSNNTAAIFYAQSSRPDLTMEVYPIGRVTSDLSIFPNLPSRVDITFEVIE